MRRALWKISVQASPRNEEAFAQVLEARGGPAVIDADLRKKRTTVSVYLPIKPDWSKTARLRLIQDLVEAAAESEPERVRVTLQRLAPEDWTESWKRHFKPLEIGKRLRIRPSWRRPRLRPGQVEVVLDPGMSFGTGQHPTTSFCLSELVRQYRPGRALSLLDIGTGSGILAIAAAKLGYQPVEATDFDQDAIRVAKANAGVNAVARQIRFKCQDLSKTPLYSTRRYWVVCANLMADLLQAQKPRILARLQPGGLLVLAGILNPEFPGLRRSYEAAGLRLVRSRVQGEWRSGSFQAGNAAPL